MVIKKIKRKQRSPFVKSRVSKIIDWFDYVPSPIRTKAVTAFLKIIFPTAFVCLFMGLMAGKVILPIIIFVIAIIFCLAMTINTFVFVHIDMKEYHGIIEEWTRKSKIADKVSGVVSAPENFIKGKITKDKSLFKEEGIAGYKILINKKIYSIPIPTTRISTIDSKFGFDDVFGSKPIPVGTEVIVYATSNLDNGKVYLVSPDIV
jgi:uncharacterized membrane protein (Fun14 family)